MVKRCAVGGCKSGYPAERKRMKLADEKQISFFSVPKRESLIDAWNDALGKGIKLSSSDFVCELHFRAKDIQSQFVTVMPDGTKNQFPRGRCRLKANALPITVQSEDGTVDSQDSEQVPSTLNAVLEDTVLLCEMDSQGSEQLPSTSNAVQEDMVLLGEMAIKQVEEMVGQCPVNDGNVLADGGCDVNKIDIENCNNSFGEAYSLDTLVEDLKQGEWRQSWVWVLGDDPLSVQFIELDKNLSPRIYCSINVNMKITISVGDNSALREIHNGTLTSFDQMMTVLGTLEEIEVCVGTGFDKERRAVDCPGFPDINNMYRKNCKFERCLPCRNLRHKLQKKRTPAEIGIKKTAVLKKLDLLNRRHKTLQKTVDKLKSEVFQARKVCSKRDECVVNEAIEQLPLGQQEAIKMCLATSKANGPTGKRYTRQWVYNCLLLRIKSKKAYCHLRDRDILPLPHPDTLGKYVKQMGGAYGFQESIFSAMKTKAASMEPVEKRGSLLVDEMKLGEGVSLDRSTLEYTGFANLGEHTPENQKQELGDHALIFMFQPFRGTWVQALACFLSKGCAKSNVLEKLMLECVLLIERAGFFVDAIVTDGASWNRGVWTLLGVNEDNVSCRHPCDVLESINSDDSEGDNGVEGGRRLWFLSDFPHLIKTMRNALMAQDETLTPDGIVKKGDWAAVIAAQEATGTILRVAHLRDDHINPKHYAKMNVPLAFELFSKRSQVAMKILKDSNNPCLQNCDATLAFMKRIDDLIQAMMSRCSSTAIRTNNAQMEAIVNFQEYLDEWERLANENCASYITKETLTGFKVSLQSVVEIFEFLKTQHNFEYLMTARLNQDALERFNGMVRSACGSNDHPNATVCAHVFRLLCMYSLIKPPRGSNVTGAQVLESLIGLHDATNNDDQKREWLHRLDEIVENACIVDEPSTDQELQGTTSDDWAGCEDLHTYAEAYMAGFIARKFRVTLTCSDCIMTLTSSTPKERDKMITLMSAGNLTYPSEGLMQLVKLIECTFLEVIGSNLRLRSNTLFDVVDSLMESRSVPLLGCSVHSASVSKRVLNFAVMSMGHFVGKSFNRAHSDQARRTRQLRKNAKL